MSPEDILTEKRDDVLLVTLNRPDRLNAWTDQMRREMMDAFDAANADAEVGHRATTICHLASICRQLGRKLQWDPKAERFIDDDQANQLISRPRRKGYELPEVG